MLLYKDGKAVDFPARHVEGALGNGWTYFKDGSNGENEFQDYDFDNQELTEPRFEGIGSNQEHLEERGSNDPEWDAKLKAAPPAVLDAEDVEPSKATIKPVNRLNAKKTIEKIKHLKDVESLENIQSEELASGDPRKSVLDAIDKQIDKLEE